MAGRSKNGEGAQAEKHQAPVPRQDITNPSKPGRNGDAEGSASQSRSQSQVIHRRFDTPTYIHNFILQLPLPTKPLASRAPIQLVDLQHATSVRFQPFVLEMSLLSQHQDRRPCRVGPTLRVAFNKVRGETIIYGSIVSTFVAVVILWCGSMTRWSLARPEWNRSTGGVSGRKKTHF